MRGVYVTVFPQQFVAYRIWNVQVDGRGGLLRGSYSHNRQPMAR
jgi:hypothetical protein